LKLDDITSERATEFGAYRQAQGLQVSTVNSSLRVLRRVLRIASEWGMLSTVPRIKMLPGERHRERVVSFGEEARYLAAARRPLASVAAVLVDTGMRPEEYRLRWEAITWVNGRNGTLLVTHGKTKAARRVLPLPPRVCSILEQRWNGAGEPQEGWIWDAPPKVATLSLLVSLKKQHRRALQNCRAQFDQHFGSVRTSFGGHGALCC
jgi:integrase